MILEIGIALGAGIVIAVIIAVVLRRRRQRNLDTRTGQYDTWSGAIIYKDSEVIKPYIGSEEEERDAERARIPKPPKSNEGEWPTSGCGTCFGHGRLNFGVGKECPDCKGKGSVPAK
jgi:hypothetical protein